MTAETQRTTTPHARLAAGLAAADGPVVLATVAEARVVDGPATVIGAVVLPAIRELRRRQREGELDPAAVAAGTSLARRALIAAGDPAATPRPGHRPVVVAATDADPGLEAEAAYEALLAGGHPAQLLVAVRDADVLQRHLGSLRPVAVAAAADDPRQLPAVAALAATAARAGVPVVATGPAFGADGARAARIGATAWAADAERLLDVLAGWQSAGGALPMHVEEPGEAALLRAAWPAVTMAAAGTGGPDEAWAQATVRALGEVLLAAQWAGDVDVLLGWLGDQLAGPDHSNVRDVHLVGLLDAVSAAMPSSLVVAAEMLTAAREELRQRILRPGRPLRPVAPAPEAPAEAPRPVPAANPAGLAAGQSIADLLLLGALSVQATAAVVAVAQPGGRWSALAHGIEAREGLNDPLLWNAMAARREPLEIPDLAAHPELSKSALAQRPHSLRWAYGVPLRATDGSVTAVFVLLDRWLRQATRREQRALAAGARQLTHQLQALRKPAAPEVPRQVAERPGRRSSLPEGQQLLRSHEVAVLFDVTERTVINWAAAGKLPSLRTIGGHLRFRADDVQALLSSRRAGG